ncbi:DUF421 domain-containing protein [Melghirimyces algeriensis]|uniref:YetF C-terminal domain-containing protein n=1 Tax=Melghirimyces algeriensis TaxID=910412 RepID=A0A521F633_9BACL|nr:Protein of unknown function [Melghirimyces algeriensis]
MNLNQLQSLLRQKNVFSIREVAYAILEADGTLTVLKKWNDSPPTRSDLKLTPQPVHLPVTLIIDGKIQRDNLSEIGWTEDRLRKELKTWGVQQAIEVFFAEWMERDGLYVIPMKP